MDRPMTYKIREWRKAKGLNQTELGERAGMHQTEVSRYELGRFTPEIDRAEQLAEALGITVFDLRQYPKQAA